MAVRAAGVFLVASALPASAQQVTFAAGVGIGSIPRALAPLCSGERRLNGLAATGRAGVVLRAFRFDAGLEYITRAGRYDAASCVPLPPGVFVDSSFAPAGFSAASVGVTAWIPSGKTVVAGLETWWILGHSSWFVGPVVGVRHGHVRLELQGRRHATSLDEVTREIGQSSGRELSREKRSEGSWGGVVRVMLSTKCIWHSRCCSCATRKAARDSRKRCAAATPAVCRAMSEVLNESLPSIPVVSRDRPPPASRRSANPRRARSPPRR